MQKTIRTATLALAALSALGLPWRVFAAPGWTFSNDSGGDGSLAGAFPAFTIYGSNNGSGDTGLSNTSFYTQTFSMSQVVSFTWSYVTLDGAAAFDPAGYILDGVETQLSSDDTADGSSSGSVSLDVAAGHTFGWYVFTIDSEGGCGELSINGGAAGGSCSNVTETPPPPAPSPPAIPEPDNIALMLAGLVALRVAAQRRKSR